MEMVEILKKAVEKGASDIHMVVGKPPMVRIRGEILELEGCEAINAEEAKGWYIRYSSTTSAYVLKDRTWNSIHRP